MMTLVVIVVRSNLPYIVFACSCVLLLRVPIMQSSDCSLLGLFLRAAFAEHNPEKWGNFSSWKRAALLTAYCKSYDFPKLNVPQQWCKPTVCAASTWVPVCPPCGNWGQREPMQICRCSCFLLHGSKIFYPWTHSFMSSVSIHEPVAS